MGCPVRLLLSLLTLGALAAELLAAPAPPRRPAKPGPPPPPWVGSWKMLWKGGCTYRVTFGVDGSYQCSGNWAGTWSLDERQRILHVEELSEGGGVLNWSVTLNGPREGILDDGSEWKLEPPDS